MPKVSTFVRVAVVVGCTSLGVAIAPCAYAQAPERDAPKSSSVYTKDGLLGPVRLGPSVGIGAPDGLRFGLSTTWKGFLGAGGAVSIVPTMGVPGAAPAEVSRITTEGFLRVHPFRGAFFAGLAGGVARTEGTTSSFAVKGDASSRVDFQTLATVVYVAPHAGFRWMLPPGVTIGFDVGVQLPVASTGPSFDATHGDESKVVDGKGKLATAMTFAANTPIPVIRLLEVGYAF